MLIVSRQESYADGTILVAPSPGDAIFEPISNWPDQPMTPRTKPLLYRRVSGIQASFKYFQRASRLLSVCCCQAAVVITFNGLATRFRTCIRVQISLLGWISTLTDFHVRSTGRCRVQDIENS
jgi:hypothetical protein